MKILFCNKYNFPFSGTEVYLFELMELMRSQGHATALFSMADSRGKPTPYDQHFVPHIDFKEKSGILEQARRAAHATYSWDARRRIRSMIKEFQPDVAHVRNIYHHLSPSILWELKAQDIPVLYHVNDFKLLCPSYNLVSKGQACEQCQGGSYWHVLSESCYPGRGSQAFLAAEAYVHKWLRTYEKCVDRFLAPSAFVRDKLIEHGWDAEKIEVLSHFQELARPAPAMPEPGAPILYFGRLSSEKGVDDLIRAMQQLPRLKLQIAGEGPPRVDLQSLATHLELSNVEFAGHVGKNDLQRLIGASRFTVLPSHAYETFGKSILESYAEERAVVASDLGSRRELVKHGETGLLFPTGNVAQLARSIEFLAELPEVAQRMGRAGRELVRSRYAPRAHYQSMFQIYEKLVRAKSGPRPAIPAIARRPLHPPKLRVAFIGGRGVVSKYSGIETYYEQAGQRLARMGHEVTVYCRNYFTPPLKEHNGMKLVRLPTIRSKHLETLIHTTLSTMHVLTQPCDIVHYHALGPALFSFIPRLFGKKTVVTVQGLDWQRKKWGWLAAAVLRLGEQAAVRLPNMTMVVSQTLQQHYLGRYGAETVYIPNGGILRERNRISRMHEWGVERGNYLLFLGRFSPGKNCHLLIEAFEQLDTDVKLVLAGGSTYGDEYAGRLRAHSSDKVRLLDWVSGDALDELLCNAMIFVLPSDLEGLSLALLDAMGAGLCVLASDVPENHEVVEGAGFTFQPGDPNDLARMLRFLISNSAVREAAGRAAVRRVRERYLWSGVAAEIEGAYFDTLNWDRVAGSGKRPAGRTSALERLAQRRVG
jgi:glycosyltransferase involved in cell wall biosynthesis